jgi:hypothetical protein
MRLFIVIMALLVAAPAWAYDLKNLSQDDVLTIGAALDAMPHGRVAGLYLRIQSQLTAEDQASTAAARAQAEKEIRDKITAEMKKDEPKSSLEKGQVQ